MSQIKILHSGGNGVIIAAPDSNPASDRTLKLPSDGDGTILTTNSSVGKVLQVVQTIKKDQFSTSQAVGSGYTDLTGLSVTITPSSTSSKIMVEAHIYNSNNNAVNFFRILRGSTFIEQPTGTSSDGANWNAHGFSYFDHQFQDTTVINILDSPSTTSATTYKVQCACTSSALTINKFYNTSNYYGITTLTAMEVAA